MFNWIFINNKVYYLEVMCYMFPILFVGWLWVCDEGGRARRQYPQPAQHCWCSHGKKLVEEYSGGYIYFTCDIWANGTSELWSNFYPLFLYGMITKAYYCYNEVVLDFRAIQRHIKLSPPVPWQTRPSSGRSKINFSCKIFQKSFRCNLLHSILWHIHH